VIRGSPRRPGAPAAGRPPVGRLRTSPRRGRDRSSRSSRHRRSPPAAPARPRSGSPPGWPPRRGGAPVRPVLGPTGGTAARPPRAPPLSRRRPSPPVRAPPDDRTPPEPGRRDGDRDPVAPGPPGRTRLRPGSWEPAPPSSGSSGTRRVYVAPHLATAPRPVPLTADATKACRSRDRPSSGEIPAASYSPRGPPPEYHRRWRA